MGCRQAVRHQTLTLTCVGSNPAIPAKYDPLAQSVEQLPFKQWVWSSNLQRVTKKADTHLGICFLAVWRFEKFNGTVRWTVPWHRLDDANSLPGALAPGQRISSGSLRNQRAAANTCSSPSFLYRHLDICPHPSRLRRATYTLLCNCHWQLLDFDSLRGTPPQRGRLILNSN